MCASLETVFTDDALRHLKDMLIDLYKNQFFDPGFLFTPSDTFLLGRTV